MSRLITLAVAVAFVAGCGSKSKLTEEQRTEFNATLASAGRSQETANSLKPGRNNSFRAEINSVDPSAQMKSKLQGHCEAVPVGTELSGGMDFSKPIKMGLEVKGASCPVTFKYITTMQMTEAAASFGMDLAYEVKDEEYKKLNDVFAMTLAGEIKGNPKSQDGGGELKGKMSSQKHGEIPTSIAMNKNRDLSELTLTWNFPGYDVELKAVEKDGKVEYFENGEKVDKEAFRKTLRQGGPAFNELSVENEVQGEQEGPVAPFNLFR